LSVRITSISFQHYKAFERFSISFDFVNVLTGANNAGKSTVIGALRALAVALRSARVRAPDKVQLAGHRIDAYRISDRVLPISVENVLTDYQSGESKITFRLSNGNRLHLHFDEQEGCVLVPEDTAKVIRTAAAFKASFPLDIVVVPVLGAVEHKEVLIEEETVNGALATSRASRHFRNYWYRRRTEFDAFSDVVSRTWPGMVVKFPELDKFSRELSMFVSEDRLDREIFWVGFGFQIWCQLLTHITRAAAGSLVVVDEPEVYLHPDVQRKLLHVLKEKGCDIVLATHSTEILSEADPGEIVLVDKRRASAERVKDVEGVQRAMSVLGSQQNITLTALARNRRVLFVEGDHDFSLLRRFARRLGLDDLATGLGLAVMPSGGFGSWKRISILAEGVAEALGTELLIGAVYDRDYYCDEEIEEVLKTLRSSVRLAHVHSKKEIENYMLVPSALERAVIRAAAERASRVGGGKPEDVPIEELLMELTEDMHDDAEVQCVDKYTRYAKSIKKDKLDGSTMMKSALQTFRSKWKSPSTRFDLVSGKEALRRLRERISKDYSVSLTDARIIDAMRAEEMPSDLVQLLRDLEDFRAARVY
jgi:AAA domain, putative AbiEii toxin, Type IV TA system